VDSLVGAALAAAVLLYVGRPLFGRAGPATAGWLGTLPVRAGRSGDRGPAERGAPDLARELADLEYDYRMDKLGAEDYRRLKAALGTGAAGQKAGGRPAPSADAGIEAEIRAAVARRRAGSPQAGAPGALFCPACGTRLLSPGQRYCHHCGGQLPDGTPAGGSRP